MTHPTFLVRRRLNTCLAIPLAILAAHCCARAESVIRVNPGHVIGKAKPWILGSNQLSYDVDYKRTGKIQTGYTCYGSGIWDPDKRAPVPELLDLARQIGVSVARFPGGCGTHTFDWKKTVGPLDSRPRWKFGVDEFMRWVVAMRCEVVWTVSYFMGDENDAADLVEYLNAEVGANPNGGNDWAAARAANGHPRPYRITYFEFGNEVYHGNHHDRSKTEPSDYARRFNQYARAMKHVDSRIKLGMIMKNRPWSNEEEQNWDRTILPVIKENVDFLVDHHYPPFSHQGWGKDPKRLVAATLAATAIIEEKIAAVKTLCREVVGRELPIAITEFNAGYARPHEPPMRHSLGAALVNAEMLRVYLRPGSGVFMANYWQFANSYWGQVKGRHSFMGGGPHIKRPNFYPFWLYAQHFGKRLIESHVSGATIDNPHVGLVPARSGPGNEEARGKVDLLAGASWRTDRVPGVEATARDGVITLNFAKRQDLNYFHAFAQVPCKASQWYEATAEVRTENLDTRHGIGIAIGDARGYNVTKSQVIGDKLAGTNDWATIATRYRTLPETEAVQVIIRRWGGVPPRSDAISGKAIFRNVQLRKYTPASLPALSALTCNASLSDDGKKLHLIVVNKDLANGQPAMLDLGGFTPTRGTAWTLTGPDVSSHNEAAPDTVAVKETRVALAHPLVYSFPPRSVTALEFVRK